MSGSVGGLDPVALRALVREVLADALPAAAAAAAVTPTAAGKDVRTVPVATEADLAALVAQVLALAEDPVAGPALRAGSIRFVPAGAPRAVGAVAAEAPAVHRVEKGAVTERTVTAAAQAGARLVLARQAVLTPLARDRARALGVEVERER